ncbi:LacI family DNA-binding transcriptional regulator [Deinococcus humi]|uniref:DNA-binding LacI/PurR family transcriptional regulator n=1 Tax=Deinococcus humi TaxID=662880 RepID=A0A7W8JXF6_9DEIO|nr:LacI family DNA-binding transcriptional regulator [Deinococcus humi]MBB5363521.1 DNA-binding LacI/PurR family transcriptional regulator [Deinococcus humi]GGO30398.1 LacI family transcriptional regulator [Deinococcus humi]
MSESGPALSRRVTSLNVARLAGVERSTVSLVLNGKAMGRVTPAVQALVWQAANQLGYRPNAAARTLRLGEPRAVALVVPQAVNPFFAPVLHGATVEARRRGYAVVLIDAEDDGAWHERLLDTLSRQSVSGLLLWSALDDTTLGAWRDRIVLVEDTRSGVPSVLLDVESGTRQVASHLLKLGHRRFGYLAARSPHPTFARRKAAFLEALRQEAGTFVWNEVDAPFELDAALQAAAALLQDPQRPTALFCDDDLLAAGAYKAARSLGLRIPADVSVVGFNDVPLARVLEPELTTVAAEPSVLGVRAVATLLDLLEGQIAAPFVLETRLIVRDSTGSPPE